MFKSLVGVVFPVAAALIYLGVTRQLFHAKVWKALHPLSGLLVVLLIAAPWHILATLRNPPYFDFTMRSAPGEYHGFLWFYFINEQLLRFLNMRYPRDYDTVPRLYFWLFHLLWLFPWSVYFPAVAKLEFQAGRPRRERRVCWRSCWTGFILVFFTFSTTQEYYSMPCYPALALLLGSAMAAGGNWIRYGTRVSVRNLRRRGGGGAHAVFSGVESSHARRYFRGAELQSGRLQAFARPYGRSDDRLVRLSAAPAPGGRACVSGGSGRHLSCRGTARLPGHRPDGVLFFQAARIAMAAFDPYLSSRPLAEALLRSPAGKLIVDHHYYTFSRSSFTPIATALLLNGRFNNLVYGSYAPGAPNVFIDDAQWKTLWLQPDRYYLVITREVGRAPEETGGSQAAHRRGPKRRQAAC